jgi:outer membrane beta-barrel protein
MLVQMLVRFLLNMRISPLVCLVALCVMSSTISLNARAEEGQFKDYDIRVIKNKYFTKRFRLELDLNAGGVMNQSFHNSYVLGAGLGFHFTEQIGLHAEFGYVLNQNKNECEVLGSSDFKISPKINEVQSLYGGYFSYTPIYGKYQLSSGDVLYFDWFFSLGGGLANNSFREGGCGSEALEVSFSGSKPQVNVGTGQRFFLGTDLAFIWNLRLLMYQPAQPGGALFGDRGVQSVVLSVGIGYFL